MGGAGQKGSALGVEDRELGTDTPTASLQPFSSDRVRQVMTLYCTYFLTLILGIGTSALNTRLLGPEVFGDLKFLQNSWYFLQSVIHCGLFITGSNILASCDDEQERNEYLGALLLACAGLSVAYSSIIFGISWYQETVFKNTMGPLLRMLSPLLLAMPMQYFFEHTLKGLNKITLLATLNISTRVLYLLMAVALNFFIPLDLAWSSGLFLVSILVPGLLTAWMLRPSFCNWGMRLREIFRRNSSLGLNVYVGAVGNVSTVYIVGMLISYTTNNVEVGYYGLALNMAQPLMIIPGTIGTVFFREFSQSRNISRRLLLNALAISLATLVAFVLCIDTVFGFIYTKDFSAALPSCKLLAVGFVLLGLGQILNNFLIANSEGLGSRNSALIQGGVNILGCLLLAGPLGAFGAALSFALSGVFYAGMIFYYYHSFSRVIAKRAAPEQRPETP